MLRVAKELGLYFLFMTVVMSIASLPLAPPTLLAAKIAPPWLVAIVATAAAVVAGIFDHWFVRHAARLESLQRVRQRRYAALVFIETIFAKAERYAKVAPFWTVVGFAAFPLPFTIVRILVPLSGYPLGRYVVAYALGRFPRIFVIATFGTVVEIPTNILIGLLVVGVVLAAGAAIWRRLTRRAATGADAIAEPAVATAPLTVAEASRPSPPHEGEGEPPGSPPPPTSS